MTALAAGSTASVTLDANDVLIVTGGNANYTATPTTGSVFTGYLTGSQRLGPFKQYVTVSLSALTAIDYSSYSETDVSPVVTASTDLTGRITSVVGGSRNVVTDLALQVGPKLRRLARYAKDVNPLLLDPLSGAGAWAISTAYLKGQIVTNGGYIYVCNVAGTSAGSGGPSGTGMGPITDNTVTWYFAGRNNPSSASPLCPSLSVSTAAPGDTPKSFPIPSAANSFVFTGGAPYLIGGNCYGFPAVALDEASLGSGSPSANNVTWVAKFMTDAPKVAIGLSQVTNTVRIRVDGRYVRHSATISAGSTAPNYVIVDFSSAGGRRNRLIEVETGGGQPNAGNSFKGTYFYGVLTDSLSSVWAPAKTDSVRAYFFGSSIEAGGNGFPSILGGDWPTQFGLLMGWDDIWNGGVGGSGFLSNTGGTAKTFRGHATDAISANADFVFAFANPNDNAQTAAAIQAEVLLFLQTIRAGLPNAVIVIGGICAGSGGPSVASLANENACSAAVTQFADPLTFFIPWATDAGGSWFSGTGKVTATTGTGNADAYISGDGVHQTDLGHAYIAQRMVAAVKTLVFPSIGA